jgi:hypothetical protein
MGGAVKSWKEVVSDKLNSAIASSINRLDVEPLKGQAKATCDRQGVVWIAKSNNPISATSTPSMQQYLLSVSGGRYKGACEATNKGMLLLLGAEGRGAGAKMLKGLLASKVKPSLSGDLWSEPKQKTALFGVCAHGIDEDFNMVMKLVGIVPCSGDSHTGEFIEEMTKTALGELGVQTVNGELPIFKKVSDNASNMKLAWGEKGRLGCFCHTGALSVKVLTDHPPVHDALARAKGVVTHFHHTTAGYTHLKSIQVEIGEPTTMLEQGCDTRWGSVQKMCLSLLKSSDSIILYDSKNIKTAGDTYKTKKLSTEHWDIIEQIAAVLSDSAKYTRMMEADNYPTSSLILKYVAKMMMGLAPHTKVVFPWRKEASRRDFEMTDSQLHAGVREGRALMLADLDHRWIKNIEKSELEFCLIAALCDVTTKGLNFITGKKSPLPEEWAEAAHSIFKFTLLTQYNEEEVEVEEEEEVDSENSEEGGGGRARRAGKTSYNVGKQTPKMMYEELNGSDEDDFDDDDDSDDERCVKTLNHKQLSPGERAKREGGPGNRVNQKRRKQKTRNSIS